MIGSAFWTCSAAKTRSPESGLRPPLASVDAMIDCKSVLYDNPLKRLDFPDLIHPNNSRLDAVEKK
jgi:hypothetical protein